MAETAGAQARELSFESNALIGDGRPLTIFVLKTCTVALEDYNGSLLWAR